MGKLLPIAPPPKGAPKEVVEDYLKAVAERLKEQERMAALLNVAFGLFLAMMIAFIVLFSKSIYG